MERGLIASGGFDSKVIIRDIATGKVRKEHQCDGEVRCLAMRDGFLEADG